MKGCIDSSGRVAAAVAIAAVLCASAEAAVAATGDDHLYRLDAVTSTAPVAVASFNNRISYVTPGGNTRIVKIAVRALPDAAGPLPVVIVAHGGGAQPNTRDPATTLPRWGESLARAGYLAINVLHGTNEGAEAQRALCQAIGYPVPVNPLDIASALADISAVVATALENDAVPAIDFDELIVTYPSLAGELEDVLAEAADESPVLGRVVETLLSRLQACQSIHGLGLWDRPHDIAAVVDALHDGVLPELDGLADLTRVAVLGHSNGTNSVLNAAGLQRSLANGVKIAAPYPDGHPRRPLAAVALSPMGVNSYGLFDRAAWAPGVTDSKEHSWAGLTNLPVLTLTGEGDNHCKTRFLCKDSDSASTRVTPFERMPAGDKYLMFVADGGPDTQAIVSTHETFGDLDAPGVCRAAELADECANTVKWIKSTVLAFLDAYVQGDNKGRRWLKSRRLLKASDGIASIQRK